MDKPETFKEIDVRNNEELIRTMKTFFEVGTAVKIRAGYHVPREEHCSYSP